MKVKLGNLKSIIEGLNVLTSKELPIKNAYWVGKTIPKLTKEFHEVEAARNKLCLKHCKKDDDGNPLTKEENGNKVYDMVDPEAFNNELFDLWNMEIEVKFTPIPVEQLDGIKITPVTIAKLDGFIIVDDPDEEKT